MTPRASLLLCALVLTTIALWPGSTLPALGLGLYDRAPMWGFALEMVYGVICWRVCRGSRSLLAMIVLGNLANITLFSDGTISELL